SGQRTGAHADVGKELGDLERIGLLLLELVVQRAETSLFGLLTKGTGIDLCFCALQAHALSRLTQTGQLLTTREEAREVGLLGT
ncbi:MAG: hypothetical protein ACK5S6_04725, partial [bacterium]